MRTFDFNCRAIFRAPRLAFSLQRMWIQLLGLMVGLAGYITLTYLAYAVAGHRVQEVWARYGLMPCLFAFSTDVPWYSWILYGLAGLVFFVAYMISATAVARATYMMLKGNRFYSWRESYKFALKKAASILMTPISLGILIGLMVLGSLVVGLAGKIPFVGEIGISVFTIVWFLLALLTVFFMVVLGVALLLTPGILASTDDDAFEALFQSFSLAWSQPWRLAGYVLLSAIISLVAMAILAFFVKKSILLMNVMLGSFMGPDFINLASNGQTMLQSWLIMGQNILQSLYHGLTPYIYFSREFPLMSLEKITTVWGSYLYAISLLFIAGWVLSYAVSTFVAGNTLAFIVLRYKKDEENLLERKDREEEQDEEEAEPDEPATGEGEVSAETKES